MPITVEGLNEIMALDGADLGHSQWQTITQDLIDAFAMVSGDHQWIHVDTAQAASGPFGATLAHGYMILSWGVPLFNELLTVSGVRLALNYGLNRARFPTPVVVGSRIRLHARIASVRPVNNGGVEVTRGFRFELEGSDKPACVAESIAHYYP